MTDRFAVGTGRCGSTLLTRMLDRHNDVIGLNEVFTGLDWGRRFVTELVDGAEVADLLDTPNHVIDMVLGKGYDAEEVTYPFRGGDRYRRGDPMPWILTSTLGHLTDDPDALWDELRIRLARRGAAPIGDHYRAFFGWLGDRGGKTAWVERSGSSVDYLAGLLGVFPHARVVHIHRDGREVAMSMRNHPFYRLAVQLTYGVMPPGVDPDDEDGIVVGWLEGDPPIELYGTYWSDQLANGEAALAGLRPGRLLTISFEEMCAAPVEYLERLADFYGLASDPGFAERAAAMVRGVPPARFGGLSPEDQSALTMACTPGNETLARLGVR